MGTLGYIIRTIPFPRLVIMTVGRNIQSGFMIAFGVAGLLTIGNGLSTWILGGKTLSSEVKRVTGIGGSQ